MPYDTALESIRSGFGKSPSVQSAVRQCVAELGRISPEMLIVFCGGKHDPEAALAAFASAYGPVPIVGGSAAGVIGERALGFSGFEVGALAIFNPAITPRVIVNHDLLE